MKLSEKEKTYFKKWELKRQHKCRFILFEGIVTWAIPCTLIMLIFKLTDVQFNFNKIDFWSIFLFFASTVLVGCCWALLKFNNIDKKFKKIKPEH